jgi:hypothetical protein
MVKMPLLLFLAFKLWRRRSVTVIVILKKD